MADAPASIAAIYQVAGVLERSRHQHAFIGGVALNTWGVPRATFDLDLAVSARPETVKGLLADFERAGFEVDPAFATGFRDRVGGMEKVHVHLPSGRALLAVDLFLESTPFLTSVLERRVEIDLGRGAIWVCTAADLVVFKVLAGRKKDMADLQNVLAVQGLTDADYVRRWTAELGLSDRLEQALREAG